MRVGHGLLCIKTAEKILSYFTDHLKYYVSFGGRCCLKYHPVPSSIPKTSGTGFYASKPLEAPYEANRDISTCYFTKQVLKLKTAIQKYCRSYTACSFLCPFLTNPLSLSSSPFLSRKL